MDTKEKLRILFNEWFDYELPNLIERKFNYELLKSKKIITIVGPRRVGKTYLQFQIIKYLLKTIPRENIIYFNFEDERLYPLNGDELTLFLPTYFENYAPNEKYPIYLFLDEIQGMPYWDKWVRRIYDKEKNLKIFITGSSSKLSTKEIASSLAGRTITINLFPMSFREFLEAKKIDIKQNLTPKKEAVIQRHLREYLLYGGFPEIIFEKDKMNKTLILQEYYNSIFYRDIIEKHNIKNVKLLDILLNLMINYTSKKISFTKLENIIKSMGYKVSKATLIEYANYAQSVFLFYFIPLFSYKIKDILQYPKKIYCVDTGLANALSTKFRQEIWALYENLVFVELLRRGKEVYYWKGNGEVDFVIKEGLKVKELIQVTYEIKESYDREVKGLLNAMDEFGLKTGLIITKDFESKEKINRKIIKFVPLFKWLLFE